MNATDKFGEANMQEQVMMDVDADADVGVRRTQEWRANYSGGK